MNHEQIEGIAAVLRESPTLTEVEVRNGAGISLRLRRPPRKAAPTKPVLSSVASQTAITAEETRSPSLTTTSSTLTTISLTAAVVGIFHALAGEATVSPGKEVKEGQVVGQIEAMRLLNECLAPAAGTIIGVLVEEGQPVEYGQLLFEIEPASGSPTP